MALRLAGLVVKASASGVEDPGFESSHSSSLKIGTPVAALPGARRYRVSAEIDRSCVSIL